MSVKARPTATRSQGRPGGVGYAQTTLNSSTAATVTRDGDRETIVVQVEAGEVRVRTDGAAPTGSVGQILGEGHEERWAVDDLQVIESGGGSATIQTWSE